MESKTKVIDLGADFRLKDRAEWERIDGKLHSDWKVAEDAIYSILELHREEIKKSKGYSKSGLLLFGSYSWA